MDYLDYGGCHPPQLALSDGRFLVSDGGKGCALAEKVESSEPLTVLTLALTGQGEDMGAFYLYSLAAKFNRENPDVRTDILILEVINSDSWARRGLLRELNAFIDG